MYFRLLRRHKLRICLQAAILLLLLAGSVCSGYKKPQKDEIDQNHGGKNRKNRGKCGESNPQKCKGKAEYRILEYLNTLTVGKETYNEKEPPPFVLEPVDPETNATEERSPWVELVIEPLLVTKISMKLMEFSTNFNVFLTWEDGRLQKPEAKLNDSIPDAVDMTGRLNNLKYPLKLWLPNIKFSNCVDNSAEVSSPNADLSKLKMVLYPWLQRITLSYKFSLDFYCPYTFTRYPFDKQRCAIQVSYTHVLTVVNWTNAVLMEDLKQIRVPPEYHLMSVTYLPCPDGYTEEMDLIECANFVFVLKRIYSQHVMLLFIPSTLIVSLSWISFWLDEAGAPPRVALGLTSLLTLATQFGNAQKDLPAVADIKAIDIWMFACMIMVFASLVEFCVVNYAHRKLTCSASMKIHPEMPKLPLTKYVHSVPKKPKSKMGDGKRNCTSLNDRRNAATCCSTAKGHKIDIYSRIIFPLAFLTFNIVFWTYFTV